MLQGWNGHHATGQSSKVAVVMRDYRNFWRMEWMARPGQGRVGEGSGQTVLPSLTFARSSSRRPIRGERRSRTAIATKPRTQPRNQL